MRWRNNSKIRVEFKGSCLKQDKGTFTSRILNFFITYQLDTWSEDLDGDYNLNDCLFGAVKLTKNADPDKYYYSECCIGFDPRSFFSLANFDWGKSFIIFGVDNSSLVYIDNK